jgi:hypothetical protein
MKAASMVGSKVVRSEAWKVGSLAVSMVALKAVRSGVSRVDWKVD